MHLFPLKVCLFKPILCLLDLLSQVSCLVCCERICPQYVISQTLLLGHVCLKSDLKVVQAGSFPYNVLFKKGQFRGCLGVLLKFGLVVISLLHLQQLRGKCIFFPSGLVSIPYLQVQTLYEQLESVAKTGDLEHDFEGLFEVLFLLLVEQLALLQTHDLILQCKYLSIRGILLLLD